MVRKQSPPASSMTSFSRKVFYLYVPLCVIPVLLMNIFFFEITQSSLRDKQSRGLAANVDLAVQSVNNELSTMVNKVVLMLMDEQVCNVFTQEYTPGSVARQTALFLIRNRISQILNLDIARNYDMRVYSDNLSLVDSINVYPFSEYVQMVGEEEAEKLSIGHVIWMCPSQDLGLDELWLSCKGLFVQEAQTFTILLVIPGSLIRDVLNTTAASSHYCAYVGPERILFESGALPDGLTADAVFRKDTIMPYIQDGFLIVSRPTRVNRFRIVSAIPLSQLSDELVWVWLSFAFGLGVILLCLLPISAWVIRTAFRRLTGLLGILEEMDINSPRLIEYHHIDELSIVITRINGFIQRNASLVNERYAVQEELFNTRQKLLSTQLKQKELELNLLQMQINPHFLYNAFSSIKNGLSLGVSSDKLAKAMDALSSFYRMSLNLGRSLYTVRDELALVRHYVTVQSYIQSQPFEVIYDFEDEVLDLKCLPLIIQPAVENVFKHARGEENKSLVLLVLCEKTEDSLRFTVSDNGIGFVVAGTSANGYGLKNMGDRIALCYGREGSMDIRSQPGQGTEVMITIPIVREDE